MNNPSAASSVHGGEVKTNFKQKGFAEKQLAKAGNFLIHAGLISRGDSDVSRVQLFDQKVGG